MTGLCDYFTLFKRYCVQTPPTVINFAVVFLANSFLGNAIFLTSCIFYSCSECVYLNFWIKILLSWFKVANFIDFLTFTVPKINHWEILYSYVIVSVVFLNFINFFYKNIFSLCFLSSQLLFVLFITPSSYK